MSKKISILPHKKKLKLGGDGRVGVLKDQNISRNVSSLIYLAWVSLGGLGKKIFSVEEVWIFSWATYFIFCYVAFKLIKVHFLNFIALNLITLGYFISIV